MRGARAAAVISAAVVAVAGCLPPPAGPEVELALEMPEGISADGLSFEVYALQPPGRSAATCEAIGTDPASLSVPPGTPFVRFQNRSDEAAGALLPDLGFGDVRVYVRARDAECRLLAVGCTDAEVGRGGPDRIAITLDALADPVGCPDGDRCLGFVC